MCGENVVDFQTTSGIYAYLLGTPTGKALNGEHDLRPFTRRPEAHPAQSVAHRRVGAFFKAQCVDVNFLARSWSLTKTLVNAIYIPDHNTFFMT